ncbi:membrane protein [Streptococcus pseudoporcinus]|uniref:Membrane protein n=1 Tax=Streptococcus pseudoporcinus TaxID=361101 RepID=A0A4U9YIB1_9STRE|nr:YlbF family regulator [Streptococcus pseudoporcinus]VTS26368.1 membrane protein [Streptococcus pseudoporcinus]VTS43112.1 membrane protein [Streptococcus pseudoporcinus]VUC71708.1 membrane protein [Streptococcus pseudoporcinus]VUD00964.1 membrane protein [Streptococcus pseudoporcinus]VUD01245.1 membrane protein [Streptococcus pseudoporcinus]
MTPYDNSLKQLLAIIEKHPSVQAFKLIDNQMKENPELTALAFDMKKNQQNAILFDKIEKKGAAKQSLTLAENLEETIIDQPLVAEYREKMQDASDLLQYITKTIEEKINKEVRNDQS